MANYKTEIYDNSRKNLQDIEMNCDSKSRLKTSHIHTGCPTDIYTHAIFSALNNISLWLDKVNY